MRQTKQFIIILLLIILSVTSVYGVNLNACAELNSSTVYNLTSDIYRNTTTGFTNNACFGINTKSDVKLECNGFKITYDVVSQPHFASVNNDNITVTNCEFNTTDATAIFLSDTRTGLINQNTFFGADGGAIFIVSNTEHIIFEENTINHQDGNIDLAISWSNSDNITIRNNLGSNLAFPIGSATDDLTNSQDIYVYNNFFNGSSGGKAMFFRDNTGDESCPTGVYVYNNSFEKKPYGENIDCFGNSYFPLALNNWYGNYFGEYTGCTDLGNGWCNDTYTNEKVFESYPLANQDLSISCSPDWICSVWGSCVNNLQNCTTVVDNNSCVDHRTYPILTQSCISCTESWIAQLGSCLTNDTQLLTYYDENVCNTTVMLPPQNGTYVSCNYCTISYHSEQTACLNDTITTYYVHDNFNTCCNVTGIPADCDLPSNSTISCATGDANLITGLVIDTSVEVGRVWVQFAGLIALLGLAVYIMFII